ncbi:hypothetical protein B0J13DRAFT_650739 [Dactylonectria estremocensis]|uniref:Uncharacterized protein n=1 Tax=Dactylonectria estremocensis TaxID=1079267 RepID=A0A9P9FCN5_9HYPO|nr:hypothetical protein B0J13DRAFT_650739 [Dactylonectria estremocensis]
MMLLDIPVPLCVQDIVREPPVSWPREEDIKVLHLIRNFGEEFLRPRDEIEQACNLASGPSNLVIILGRPHKRQNYAVLFSEFVKRCETLKRVDELIRFGSKGARSIHTVTVLDAFSFKPSHETPIPSKRCHQLLADMLELKRPKVVLCCWNRRCEQTFAVKFKSWGVGTWPVCDRMGTTIAIRSFHPAAAVCYDLSQKPCCRMLLICHFALAFSQLAGSTVVPSWIKTLCDNSSIEFRTLRNLERTSIILMTLLQMMEFKRGSVAVPLAEGVLAARQRDEVNEVLKQLFAANYNKGAREIANLCLLWKDYLHPARQDVLRRLGELGSQQDLFQTLGSNLLTRPALRYKIKLAGSNNNDDDGDLEKRLQSLRIHGNATPVDEELVRLSQLRTRLSHRKVSLERLENVANETLSHVQLSIELQVAVFSPGRIGLSESIAEVTKDIHHALDEVAAQITTTPSILVGGKGVTHYEETLRSSFARSPDARNILDLVIPEVEGLANLAFRCSLLFSGLVAQWRMHYGPPEDSNQDTMERLFEIPNDIKGYSTAIMSALNNLSTLQELSDNPEQLLKTESLAQLPRKKNEGLPKVYRVIRGGAASQDVSC